MADIMDILDINDNGVSRSNSPDVDGKQKTVRRKKGDDNKFDDAALFKQRAKKPEGMSRELYALLFTDNKNNAPIIASDFNADSMQSGGYKKIRAKLGMRKVRPWHWMPFKNPGRSDGFMLFHWRRVADEGPEYPFAKFNKKVQIPLYTDAEYQQLLTTENWTKAETDHLFTLCRRFDLRFVIIHDRWDRQTFQIVRSVEDLKERYYNVYNILIKARTTGEEEPEFKYFDAEHERKRKEQLSKLFNRTTEQIEEEQKLLEELRKIELRKKEREKKTQDLQKLITAADKSSMIGKRAEISGAAGAGATPRQGPGRGRKRLSNVNKLSGKAGDSQSTNSVAYVLESVGIKFPEIKSSGVSLRSHKMKLPTSVGTKKTKAIEQLLIELGVDLKPMPTEEICQQFNELRSDMVLLYELKLALASSEFELQTLKHQYEAIQPGKTLEIPGGLHIGGTGEIRTGLSSLDQNSTGNLIPTTLTSLQSPKKQISELIEVDTGPNTPNKKRKAALEQGNLMKKLKKI